MLTFHNKIKNPILTVMICHLPERYEHFNTLIESLKNDPDVEIISENSPRGFITTGMKRNTLLLAANGKYCAFVDDDDSVDEKYSKLIIEATKTNPDCIGICGMLLSPKKQPWTFRHSITVERWCKDSERKIYFRTPNHLNPIKTEIARKIKFKDITIGEDKDYSDKIKSLLKNEIFIEQPIYYYFK